MKIEIGNEEWNRLKNNYKKIREKKRKKWKLNIENMLGELSGGRKLTKYRESEEGRASWFSWRSLLQPQTKTDISSILCEQQQKSVNLWEFCFYFSGNFRFTSFILSFEFRCHFFLCL